MYYNTARESKENTAKYSHICETQEKAVLKFFRANPAKRFATHQVFEELNLNCELQDTRRAITDLTKEGKLKKLTDKKYKVIGRKKILVHTWELNTPKLFKD